MLYGDALVGGLLSCTEIGKLECPGEGFRKKLDPAGPEAVGKKLVEQFGGWSAFQRLLDLIKAVAKKHDCNCSTVSSLRSRLLGLSGLKRFRSVFFSVLFCIVPVSTCILLNLSCIFPVFLLYFAVFFQNFCSVNHIT